MRCLNCDYALWNIEPRTCPECGSPFKVSGQEHVPNGLRFCCPHCDQAYYGTGPRGNLVPIEFDCVGCGQHVHMDDTIVRPRPGMEVPDGRYIAMPWLQDQRSSLPKRWLKTVGRSMLSPVKLIESVPVESPLSRAWVFAAITIGVFGTTSLVAFIFLPLVAALLAGGGGGGVGAALTLLLGFIFSTVLFVVLMLFIVVIWSFAAHLVLRLTGGTASTAQRTLQSMLYSSGAIAPGGAPCFGSFMVIGLGWWIVSAILMIGSGQRVSGWRASLAVLIVPVLLTGLIVTGVAGLAQFGMGKASTALSGLVGQGLDGLTIMEAVIDDLEDDGALSAHGLALVTEQGLDPNALCAGGSTPANVMVLGTSLEDAAVDPGVGADLLARAEAQLPSDVTAHRVGDVVFTWHGVDPAKSDPTLWIFVISPVPPASGDCVVGRLNGKVEVLKPSLLRRNLATQNTTRAAEALPALPDPLTITEAAPATATSVPAEESEEDTTDDAAEGDATS